MSTPTKHLYLFLAACGGNWRNSVYITSQEKEGEPGYLLAADRDGRPIVISAGQFYQLTGVLADSTECCGCLTAAGFESLFSQYLLWHTASNGANPLLLLDQELSKE